MLAPDKTLPDLLAEAIDQTRADHEDRCDLSNPSTPASTVSLLRKTADAVEYLVLCDSPVVIERGTEVEVITDGRHAASVAQIRADALDDVSKGYGVARCREGVHDRRCLGKETMEATCTSIWTPWRPHST